jgi:hypothetical protein
MGTDNKSEKVAVYRALCVSTSLILILNNGCINNLCPITDMEEQSMSWNNCSTLITTKGLFIKATVL